MKITDFAPGVIGITTAFAASLCCVLPLAIVALGLGSGAFMMVTMQYRIILYPIGFAGLAAAYTLYFRRKRACDLAACKMEGKRFNLSLLIVSTALMAAVTYFDFFLDSM